MHFEPGKTYHIYNRSNETVFRNRANYIYFLSKVKARIKPNADILAWCLMPNHFHFLVVANNKGCKYVDERHRPNTQELSKNIGSLLSGYTRALNKDLGRRGRLFAHNTVAKCLNDIPNNTRLLETCFHYIHQNPLKAGLCQNCKDWEFSSFLDYAGFREGNLINKDLAFEMINYNKDNFEV